MSPFLFLALHVLSYLFCDSIPTNNQVRGLKTESNILILWDITWRVLKAMRGVVFRDSAEKLSPKMSKL